MDCPKCGAVLKADARYCDACGTTVGEKRLTPESMKQEHNYDMFKETRTSGPAGGTREGEIYSPELWMYIVSVFFPVLQWILMGVYIAKNQFDDAKSLFVRPLIIQIVVYIVCAVLLFIVMDL